MRIMINYQTYKSKYKTIVKRFLAIFYPPAINNKIQVVIEVESSEKNVETFSVSSTICVEKGYLEILKPVEKKASKKSTDNEENVDNSDGNNTSEENNNIEENNNLEALKTLKKGQEIETQNYEIKDAETTPPKRYTTGDMISAMENAGRLIEDEELREQIKGAGIGTSATRAGILEKLEKIKYMETNSKTQIITPTQKGEIIYDIVNMSMPDMLNPKLTASWEKGLEMVAKKEIKPEVFMGKLDNYIHSKFDKLVVKM